MLFIPLLSGILHHGSFTQNSVMFFLSALFAFLAYRPAEMTVNELRRGTRNGFKLIHPLVWVFLYLIPCALLFGSVAFQEQYRMLLLLPLPVGAMFAIGQYLTYYKRMPFARDFFGILALSMLAPGSYFVASGGHTTGMMRLYFANGAFFLSSAFYVHLLYFSASSGTAKTTLRHRRKNANVLYQSLLLASLLGLFMTSQISLLWLLAFCPMVIHALTGTFLLNSPVNFRRLGLTFLAYSVWFLLLISV